MTTTDICSLPPHIRWQRALRALAKLLRNPDETDVVLEFTSLANAGSNVDRIHEFYAYEDGQQLWDEQRALDSKTIDLDALYALPSGTLGHAYASFMKRHGLTPNVFDGPPENVADSRTAYVLQRMRQTHDLWHVVNNVETDPAGEVALQAFYYAHLGAPSTGIIAFFGTLKTLRHEPQILRDVFEMIRRGRHADRMATFHWEDHWATPLAEVRQLLGLPKHPRLIGGYTKGVFESAA
ncbi:MAG TPA: Coq4 family protein [Kofleriaceae bacterium]